MPIKIGDKMVTTRFKTDKQIIDTWNKFVKQDVDKRIRQIITENCSSFGINKEKIISEISDMIMQEQNTKVKYIYKSIKLNRQLQNLKAKNKK